jgi:hypothetical protein
MWHRYSICSSPHHSEVEWRAPGSHFLQLIALQSYHKFSLSRCLFEGNIIHNRLIENKEEKGRATKEVEKKMFILKKIWIINFVTSVGAEHEHFIYAWNLV